MTKSQITILIISLLLPYYLTFLTNGEIVYSFALAYLATCSFIIGGIIIAVMYETKQG